MSSSNLTITEQGHKDIQRAAGNTMINVKDFTKRNRFVISPNDDKNVTSLKQQHNERYDIFLKDILMPRTKDNMIRSDDASFLWIVYTDEFETLNFKKHENKLRPINKELVDYWIDMFKKSHSELYHYGINTISSAYGLLIDYYRQWYTNQKYEKIYSKGKTFDDFLELANENIGLIDLSEEPFDMKSIASKAQMIIASKK